MVAVFQDRLRQIREEQDQAQRQARAAEAERELARASAVELRLERREQLEHVIDEYAQKFSGEVVGFVRTKSFFEGKYRIELHCDEVLFDAQGHLGKFFSRLTFLLEIQPDAGAIQVHVKKTVINGDRDSSTYSVDYGTADLSGFSRFVEEQFVEFAADFLKLSRGRTLKPVPTP